LKRGGSNSELAFDIDLPKSIDSTNFKTIVDIHYLGIRLEENSSTIDKLYISDDNNSMSGNKPDFLTNTNIETS
jgi:hypothetical protein